MKRNPSQESEHRSLIGRGNPKPGVRRCVGPRIVAPGVPSILAPRGKDRTSELNGWVIQTLGHRAPKEGKHSCVQTLVQHRSSQTNQTPRVGEGHGSIRSNQFQTKTRAIFQTMLLYKPHCEENSTKNEGSLSLGHLERWMQISLPFLDTCLLCLPRCHQDEAQHWPCHFSISESSRKGFVLSPQILTFWPLPPCLLPPPPFLLFTSAFDEVQCINETMPFHICMCSLFFQLHHLNNFSSFYW